MKGKIIKNYLQGCRRIVCGDEIRRLHNKAPVVVDCTDKTATMEISNKGREGGAVCEGVGCMLEVMEVVIGVRCVLWM